MESYVPVKLAYNILDPDIKSVIREAKTLSPIIFLHGAALSKEHWGDIPQVVANSTRRRVYVLDARNHGDSEWSDAFNFDVLADDLFHFMDSLNISKSVLIGHGMGGITAYKAALKRPNKVEALIVEDMLVRQVPQPMVDNLTHYIRLLRKSILDVPPDFHEDGAKKCIIDTLVRDEPQIFHVVSIKPYLDIKRSAYGRWAFKSNMEVLYKALCDQASLMTDPDGEYAGPTCFMYGVYSPYLVGKDEFHIKKFFPKAEFVPFDASHDTHRDKPLEFADAVIKFVLTIHS